MRITELETIVIQQPGPLRVIEDSIHRIASGRDLVVRLHTESGIFGTYTLSIAGYGGELTRQLFEVEMRKLVVGQDASMPRRLRRHLFDQTEYYGVNGLGVFGISVIDYCVWGHPRQGEATRRLPNCSASTAPKSRPTAWLGGSTFPKTS